MSRSSIIPEYRTMDRALQGSLEAILKSGQVVAPRGKVTRELLGWTFRLTRPRARKIHIRARRWSESLAIGELCWHLSGSDDLRFISYYSSAWTSFSDDGERIAGSCYGKHIFSRGKRASSQWDLVKKTLRHDPYSRRAVLILYPTAHAGQLSTLDLPCFTTIQFLIRNRRLNCIGNMRSNDVIWGLCYDVYFATMLQEILALELGLSLGWYQHTANSIHIYKPFLKMTQEIVAEELPDKVKGMPIMTDVSCLPKFLAIERQLRGGDDKALGAIQNLAPYWQSLALPLVAKFENRKQKVTGVKTLS